jgi:isoleucyl-tRNA synthetase
MLANRPDWLVSRQREWGVPLGLYVHKNTGEVLALPCVVDDIRENGIQAWMSTPTETHFEKAGRTDSEEYEKTTDILDVWFDSACVPQYGSHTADLVVEGTDQHRGWFSSVLLKACALGDPLPFKTVLTHGFVLDSNNDKMSKSKGNGLTPNHVVKKYGPDILRLWVCLVDVTKDVPFSLELLDEATSTRNKIRNTMRFFTGVLRDWSTDDQDVVVKSALDRLLFEQTKEFVSNFNNASLEYDFREMIDLVKTFTDHTLGYHIDARKDVLYCSIGTPEWHSIRKTFMFVYSNLLSILDTLCPHMVREIKSYLDPVDVNPVLMINYKEFKSILDLAIHDITALRGDIKLMDAHYILVDDYKKLLGYGSYVEVARWLRVDQVSLGEESKILEKTSATCTRCRLHHTNDDEWCVRCNDVENV